MGAGSVIETMQFNSGLRDLQKLNGKLLGFINMSDRATQLLTLLFMVQSCTFGYKVAEEGIEKIWRGEWEPLSGCDKIKANTCSLAMAVYTIFADAIATTYYIRDEGYGLSEAAQFIIGVVTALSSLPTENYETDAVIRLAFSTGHKATTAAFKKIQQSSFYVTAPVSFKSKFDEFWQELAIHIKIGLLKNNSELLKDKKALTDKISALFEITDAKMITAKLIALNLEEQIANHFANAFAKLIHGEYVEEKDGNWGVLKKLGNFFYSSLIVSMKGGGGYADMVESYSSIVIFVELLLGFSSPWVRWPALVFSGANGINDIIFYGENSQNIMTNFKEKLLSGKYSYREVILFALAIVPATMVGQAQFFLILEMLKTTAMPVTLSAPLLKAVGQLLDALVLVLGITAGMRELVYYTDNFLTVYHSAINGVEHLTDRVRTSRNGHKAIAFNMEVMEEESQEPIEEWTNITNTDVTVLEDKDGIRKKYMDDEWVEIEKPKEEKTSSEDDLAFEVVLDRKSRLSLNDSLLSKDSPQQSGCWAMLFKHNQNVKVAPAPSVQNRRRTANSRSID